MTTPGTFLDLVKIETDQSAAGRYIATFQARTPEGDFTVAIGVATDDEARVFRTAKHRMRRMLARLAAVTSDWAVPELPSSGQGGYPDAVSETTVLSFKPQA